MEMALLTLALVLIGVLIVHLIDGFKVTSDTPPLPPPCSRHDWVTNMDDQLECDICGVIAGKGND